MVFILLRPGDTTKTGQSLSFNLCIGPYFLFFLISHSSLGISAIKCDTTSTVNKLVLFFTVF